MKLRCNMGCNNFLLDLSLGSMTTHIKTQNCIEGRLLEFEKMTNLNGMDELFWGKEFEDVIGQIERLEMVAKVKNYNKVKPFKIANLNLRGKAK